MTEIIQSTRVMRGGVLWQLLGKKHGGGAGHGIGVRNCIDMSRMLLLIIAAFTSALATDGDHRRQIGIVLTGCGDKGSGKRIRSCDSGLPASLQIDVAVL